MSEAETISRVKRPNTVDSLTTELRALGVQSGDLLLVHSSLSALGWTAGGPHAVVLALLEALGPDGTLVMPTHSGQYTDPAGWEAPPVPADWIATIRSSRPAFDPDMTPTRGMGAIVECFRTHPKTLRSLHPIYSFAANGPLAEAVTRHEFDFGLGEGSPLRHLYDRNARVLLLGVGYECCTSLHLAEHRADLELGVDSCTLPVRDGEGVKWVTFEELDVDSDDFAKLGLEWERHISEIRVDVSNGASGNAGEHPPLSRGSVGAAVCRLLEQRPLVDYASSRLPTIRRR
ncbi:MAG: aminoglycoside N(3)-acetyltransferase [Spirochaetales bacterium]